LWDKLVYTLNPRKKFHSRPRKVLRANRLAAAINFCCQGYPFLLAGEEFGRTKGGIKNSYNASPEINKLDWSLAWENHTLVNYYRGLIALRKKLICLQDKSPQAHQRILSAVMLASGCAGLSLDNRGFGSKWDKVLLIYHVGKEPVTISLPDGAWQVLADDKSSFRWRGNKTVTGTAQLTPVSALILGRVSGQ